MSDVIEKIEKSVSGTSIANSKFVQWILPAVVLLLVSLGLYSVFVVVPNERIMGAVQRVFYFHVGAAMATYLAVAILLLGSVFFLIRRTDIWDMLAHSSAGVALMFATQVLATGMIWGHSAWNVWWRWEPRLVSFLILWLLLMSYCLLRALSKGHSRQKNFSAIVGILSAVNVPIVVYSVKLLNASEQLHPQVVANQGLRDSSYVFTLILCIFSMLAFAVWLISIALQQKLLEQEVLRSQRIRARGNR